MQAHTNDNLEAMAQQIFDYWFIQYNFPDSNGLPYKSNGGILQWSDALNRELPEEWQVCQFQDICSIKRGASPRPIDAYMDDSHKGMPWLKISDATSDDGPFITKIKEHIILDGVPKSVRVGKDTLVVSNSATPGIPKFMQIDACVHDGWLVLGDYEDYYSYYIFFVIKMIRNNLLHMATGSVFKNLNTDYLKQYYCIKPDETVVKEFHNNVRPIFREVLELENQINFLEMQRDQLLSGLMVGQFSIS